MARIKGIHYEREIVEVATKWNRELKLSCRKIESLMRTRGVAVDHATINRWIRRFESEFSPESTPEAVQTMTDNIQDSYVKVRGKWRHLFTYYDEGGVISDFLLLEDNLGGVAAKFFANPSLKERSVDLNLNETDQQPHVNIVADIAKTIEPGTMTTEA